MKSKVFNPVTAISILVLILVDQIVKLMVKGYYDSEFTIVRNILYFRPTMNVKYSWINSMLNLGAGKGIHIVAVIVVIFIFYYIFKYIHRRLGNRLSIDIIMVMLFSGALCSLIDKLFWNGSLDFVYLKGFFVFDIKDCYLTLSEISAAVLIFRNWDKLSRISTRETLLGIISLIKKDFTFKKGD